MYMNLPAAYVGMGGIFGGMLVYRTRLQADFSSCFFCFLDNMLGQVRDMDPICRCGEQMKLERDAALRVDELGSDKPVVLGQFPRCLLFY